MEHPTSRRATRHPIRTRPLTGAHTLAATAVALALGLAACDGAAAPTTDARCLPDAPDCVDTPGTGADDDVAGDALLTAFVDVVPSLPEGTRFVETAPGAPTFPLMVRQAAVDGTDLHLLVGAGEAPCMWLVGTEVTEDADQVVVSVLASGDAEATDCDQQAVTDQALTVRLAEPLGDRALLDATRVVPGDAQS